MSPRRLPPIALLLLLPLAGLAAPAVPGSASVYLRPAVYLAGETYTLGDIASVPAGEPQEAGLLSLPLGRSPRRPTLIAAQLVGELLAAAGYTQVVVVGGRVALLPRQGVPAAAQRFYEDLLAYLDRSDNLSVGRIEVEILQVGTIASSSAFVFAPVGSPAPRAGAGSSAPLAGELLLSYGPPAAGAGMSAEAAPRGTVRLWVHRYLPVAFTAIAVPARSRLDAGQVGYREEDVSLSAQAFLTRADRLEGYRSAAALPAGVRIEPRHLERALAVRTGEAVQVVFLRPGLRVVVPGRAGGSGAVGERIEVRLSAGGKRFEGLIAAGGEVCVEGF
jgi:flagella basal body P-ring formation protein FlgA